MTTEARRFETDVPGIGGLWPDTPVVWSYSSLKEMELCPRRWMLSRATYPDLWSRKGYPPLPVVAALFGNVVHGVIERLATLLADLDGGSVSTSATTSALHELGGWRGIVLSEIEDQLTRFRDNPRVTLERISRVRDELVRLAPQAADQVKSLLHGRAVSADGRHAPEAKPAASSATQVRSPVSQGTHVERDLCADDLRLTGRIDLLMIDDADVLIADFKTGKTDASHDDQVQLYALLWKLDVQSNPERRLATKLEVAYSSNIHSVDAPNETQLRALQTAAVMRIAAADAVTSEARPTATPSAEACQFCPVKHLCDVYWQTAPVKVAETGTGEWFDFEGRVLRTNGTRSWYLESSDALSEVLVRTVQTNVPFPPGDRVRLLGVRRTIDPDDQDRLVVSMVNTSEWYAVSS